MSRYIERAMQLRRSVHPHYNCAQSVLLPFVSDFGMTEEIALPFAASFGGGMKMGSICGVLTGGLMVLGLYGLDDPETVQDFFGRFEKEQQGRHTCTALVDHCLTNGGEKKPFCDALVCQGVQLCETILREKGKI